MTEREIEKEIIEHLKKIDDFLSELLERKDQYHDFIKTCFFQIYLQMAKKIHDEGEIDSIGSMTLMASTLESTALKILAVAELKKAGITNETVH